ncbi:MAG: AAA family ATPase [Deltaproteobacteria bacterium]|nr:MAG: AAA family ATPase [Deltaproteobacteria bacterium]
MYKEFYQLKDNPFRLAPDPRYFLFSSRAKGVFDQLLYGLQQGVGFMMVTGEIGVGKTSLLRYFLQHLDNKVERAFLFNPMLGSSEELIKFILMDLTSLDDPDRYQFSNQARKVELLDHLYRFLVDRYQKGKKVLLIIDEAQALPDMLLEEVRLLSNFEADNEKLLHLLLVGQPELKKRIFSPSWKQLRQRIAIKSELVPLNKEEVEAYIRYRLIVAGTNEDIFQPRAIKTIYRASKGIPRLINLIAERSLIAGFIGSKKKVGKKEVKMALKDLDLG